MRGVFIFLTLFKVCISTCLLDWDYVGDYETQMISSSENDDNGNNPFNITYSKVSIKQDGVSLWGHCHRKIIGSSIIFRDVNGCFQCIRLEKLSPTIVRVWTSELNRCFNLESHAKLYCPKGVDISSNEKQLFLFRSIDGFGSSNFTPSLCPLSGRFLISQSGEVKSLFSTCPNGNIMRMEKYFLPSKDHERLSSALVEMEMECLGHWENGDSSMTLFINDRSSKRGKAKFRCARIEQKSNPLIIFSSNATCPNSFNDGKAYALKKIPHKPLPSVVAKGSSCRFPSKLIGRWTNMDIGKYVISYKDMSLKQSFSYHCVRISPRNPERYIIYLKSSCGHEWYGCLWIVQRSPNVLEFQIGKEQSTNPSLKLCNNDQFLKRTWSIEARFAKDKTSLCPIAGIYTGQLPDAPILCAKLKSDCKNQEYMMYKVTFCLKKNILYEEREYQCLGQWTEGKDEHIFTYVKRRDLQSFECFVGKRENDSIYLIESGATCRRGLQVKKFGMELKKMQSCSQAFQEPIGTNEISDYIKSSQTRNSPTLSYYILLGLFVYL